MNQKQKQKRIEEEQKKKKKESGTSWLETTSDFFGAILDAFTPSHSSHGHDHDSSSIFDSIDFDLFDD